MRLRKGISGITSFLILLAVFILLLCLTGAYYNPTKFPVLGIASLLIGPMIIVNIFLLGYCILRKKKVGYGVLIALGLASPQILNLWGFNLVQEEKENSIQHQIKILSFNVRNFDLYNWSHNHSSKEIIFKKIKEQSPDVICFQEFYSMPDGEWDNIKRLKEELGLNAYFFSREFVKDKDRQWGIATFSKYPIIKYEELLKSDKKNQLGENYYKGIYTDIAFSSDTIRIINMHLASYYFNNQDYSTIEKISEPEAITISESKPIIFKMLKGYKKRGIQVKELDHFINKMPQPHPIVICGDFNDIPTSFAYNRISKQFQDGFLKKGWGIGSTYNGIMPGLRIDFTLVDRSLIVNSSTRVDLDISDHFPLLTTISIKK